MLVAPLAAPEATDPARFGPKAANLARLAQAGLPTPGGYAIDAAAYRDQLKALDLEPVARAVFAEEDSAAARRHALSMKLGLMDQPIAPGVLASLLQVWRAVDKPCVVRSSALVEDRYGSSFAGQFESFLGLETEAEFITAVRACWAALWMTRALRYMATHDIDPATTAMALIAQPLVDARAAGGGLSRTADGEMLINATRGLGASIAQGEVVPDRYVLTVDGRLKESAIGRKYRRVGCLHSARAARRPLFAAPCLEEDQVIELGRMMAAAEKLLDGPVEIEWAIDDRGLKLLQARPLHLQAAAVPDEIWLTRPRLSGHPAGVGWGTGRACVVNCECELARVAPGDVLVTTVAGPALADILPRVAGVVAELGGSTSHLASIARERGTPMVLGVPDATQRIPDGAEVAVDGVAGIVRWTKGEPNGRPVYR
jgi:pyruvate,water dikinase